VFGSRNQAKDLIERFFNVTFLLLLSGLGYQAWMNLYRSSVIPSMVALFACVAGLLAQCDATLNIDFGSWDRLM